LYVEERVKPIIAVAQGATGKKKCRKRRSQISSSADNDEVIDDHL